MAKKLVIVVVLLQLAALVYMAGQREFIRAFGDRVYLRTAPIDPRAPFRGDYVRLRYRFSSLAPEFFRGDSEPPKKQGSEIYTVLEDDGSGVYVLDYMTDREPEEGVFLHGRTTDDYRLRRGPAMGVKYGIEQYFVEQGRGRDIERRLGGRGEMQVPMEVQAAVGSGGTAVLIDYRWSQLGVQIEVLRRNRRNPNGELDNPSEPLSPRLRLSYQNVSDEPLVLFNDDNNCGIELTFAAGSPPRASQAGNVCDGYRPARDDAVVLGPGDTYARELELSERRWHVIYEGETVEIGKLPPNTMFRFVYRAPPLEEINGQQSLPAPIWKGRLPSQAFNAMGWID